MMVRWTTKMINVRLKIRNQIAYKLDKLYYILCFKMLSFLILDTLILSNVVYVIFKTQIVRFIVYYIRRFSD